MKPLGGVRWLMIGLIFLATVINYIDRQTLAVLKKTICDDLGLSDVQYAYITTSFLVAYALSQFLSGWLYDVVGTRAGFTLSIVVWSAAATAHTLARGVLSFSVFRALLGLGEAGNWPGAAKAIGEWFPIRERALAMGVFNTGAALGGAASPPIIAWLALSYGWRPTFVITGLLGFAWLALWLWAYRLPAEHPWLTTEEKELIESGQRTRGAANPAPHDEKPRLVELLRHRQTWAVVVARFLTDPIWWLYVIWLPSYFQAVRGFDLRQLGATAWFPYLAGGIGALVGGWASGHLIKKGWSIDAARKTVMAVGALLTPAGIVGVTADDPYVALGWMGLVLFGFQIWVNNLQTLPADFFPKSAVASVAGLGGLSAGIANVLYNLGTGYVVHSLSYTPVFVAAGLLGPLGLASVLMLAGRIEPVALAR